MIKMTTEIKDEIRAQPFTVILEIE